MASWGEEGILYIKIIIFCASENLKSLNISLFEVTLTCLGVVYAGCLKALYTNVCEEIEGSKHPVYIQYKLEYVFSLTESSIFLCKFSTMNRTHLRCGKKKLSISLAVFLSVFNIDILKTFANRRGRFVSGQDTPAGFHDLLGDRA